MSQVIKARVINGRYKGQVVRVTNVSVDTAGKKKAAVFLEDGSRANVDAVDLEVMAPEAPKQETPRAKISMPFMSGSTGSRSLNQTRSLEKKRPEHKAQSSLVTMQKCEACGEMYDVEKRKGMPGKLTECEDCARETEVKVEGSMIFSHKTGATIEIKKDGELIHEAATYDPKNKT